MYCQETCCILNIKLMLLNVVSEKTLESPLDCKEIKPVHPKWNQSWIFIGRTDAEAEAPYFGHLMQRTELLEKTLMLGKTEGGRRRGRQRMKWLDGIPTRWTWVWASSGSWWRTGIPGVLQSMGLQRAGHDWITELNWTELVGKETRWLFLKQDLWSRKQEMQEGWSFQNSKPEY